MKNLSLDEFNRLTQGAILLADDEHGKKVLELTDHSIVKLFRVKRLISQATIYSPARRFARNATKLQTLDIPTVSLIDLYKIKSIKRTAVHYHQLEGVMVREYLQSNHENEVFLTQLGEFIAQLHSKGIFFRSAHFGNIIYTTDKQFGLIDISDMSVSHFSLNVFKRLRNLKHIFRIPEDIQFIQNSQAIEEGYLKSYSVKKYFFSAWFEKKFLQTSESLKASNR